MPTILEVDRNIKFKVIKTKDQKVDNLKISLNDETVLFPREFLTKFLEDNKVDILEITIPHYIITN